MHKLALRPWKPRHSLPMTARGEKSGRHIGERGELTGIRIHV